MKILATGTYKSKFDYFTIVIDKQRKEIFALKNFTCRASEFGALADLFKISNTEAMLIFSLYPSSTEINESVIPTKYRKFTILK